MVNSKLITLLRTLNGGEIQKLGNFIASPYFNSNCELRQFFNHLQKLYPIFPEECSTKEIIFEALFPNTPFNKKKLGYLMSDLFKLIERFLSIQRLEREEVLLECQILSEYTERNLEKHYAYQIKGVKDIIETKTDIPFDSSYYQYLVADIEAKHFAARHRRVFDVNLQKAADALDDFYFLNKLKYSCEMLNRQAILSDQFSLPFMEAVLDFLNERKQLPPLLAIYLHIYFCLLYPKDEKYLDTLLDLVHQHSASIPLKELRDVYLYAINFGVRKIREGKEKYIAITLGLYEEGINNESLYDDKNNVSQWTYNNMVKLALRLKRFSWIESFITNYNGLLQQQVREDALHYNLAELFFHKKDYDKALEHLNQVQFSDINYHLGSRILLIKTFYELDDFDPLLNVLASFSVWLRRNKQISVSLKKSCLHFCNLLSKVLANNQRKKERIFQQIKETQPLADRSWLLKIFEDQMG